MRTGIALAVIACFATAACAGDGDKVVMPPEVLGMLETTAAAYDDGETQIYQVSKEVKMPFRRANDDERPSGGQVDPYPRAPFHIAPDTRITVRYTLSNLEDRPHTVELLIDPWNEFVRYRPGVAQGDEETIPNFSGIDRFFVVPPKGRIEGIFTPDDMVELATDLATAMALARRPPAADGDFGGPGLFNRAFNVQNRSSEPDPVLAPWLPKGPIAAVIGFDLGLRTYERAKIAVELVIDIEDLNGERVVKTGEDDRLVGRPGTILSPPAGAAPM
jgi:hypothetical protein